MNKISGKVAYLDGVRGVAALCVFFHHYLLAFYSSYYTLNKTTCHLPGDLEVSFGKSIFSVLANGQFYVSIFFVLSGYVLSRKYFLTRDFEIIRSGAIRRYLRLFIPVAAAIILSFFIMQGHLYYNIPASVITRSWWLNSFWKFTDVWHKLWYDLTTGTMFLGDASFDNSMWTLNIELYGSMFVFAFLAFTHHIRHTFFILALLFLVFFMLHDGGVHTTFIFGIGLNYLERLQPRINQYLANALAAVLLVIAFTLGSFPPMDDISHTLFEHFPAFLMQYSPWFVTFASFFFVTAFVLSAGLQRLIGMKFFRFLGFISFSFYLLHPIVIGSFSSYLFLQLCKYMAYNPAVLVVFFASLAVAFVLSWLMAKYIDAWGVRFSKQVYEWWFKKKAASTGLQNEA